jgi:phospholipid/cholesterol/gamma-HCH transport system substrate-binding protein
MNQNQMTARVGLFFIIGLALIWVTFEALHNGRFSTKEGYTVTAAFSSLKELKAGNDVRMAGVQVGTVEKTRLTGGKAEAVLRINSEVQIAQDATAIIAMAGLLGANYISLDLGHPDAGTVPPGGQLRTKDVADLNQIIGDLGNLGQEIKSTLGQISGSMGSGSDGQGGLFQKLDKLVADNSAKITATTTNLEQITNQIRSGHGTVGKLIYDQAAYDQLLSTVAEIKATATDARTFLNETQTLVAQVKSGQGALGVLLYDQPTADNLRVTVKNIRDVSDKLNDPKSTFGQLITNDNLVKDVQGTLRKVDRAMDGLGDQGPITAVGAAAGALF